MSLQDEMCVLRFEMVGWASRLVPHGCEMGETDWLQQARGVLRGGKSDGRKALWLNGPDRLG